MSMFLFTASALCVLAAIIPRMVFALIGQRRGR